MLRDGATALKADLEAGTTGLIGTLPARDTLDVAPVDVDTLDTTPVTTLITAHGRGTPTTEPIVELPLLACLAEPAARVDDAVDANPAAGTSTDQPIQLSLFGDVVVAPAQRSRRGRPTITRGVPAAA